MWGEVGELVLSSSAMMNGMAMEEEGRWSVLRNSRTRLPSLFCCLPLLQQTL